MNNKRLLGVMGAAIAALAAFGSAAVDNPPPHDSGLVENVEVRLVIVDVLVLDRKGNPVAGLAADDFDVEVNGHSVPLVSFDDTCVEAVQKPNIVLAFDYQHLDEAQRGQILDSARTALGRGEGGTAAIMVAALTGGLRVEQPFTKDLNRVQTTLDHMRNDVSLWAGNFSHRSEDGFVRGLTSLFDVVGTFPGPTAVILYSGMQAVPLDEQFRQLAAQAAAARCAVYPVSVEELSATPRLSQGTKPAFRGDTRMAPPLTLPDDDGEAATGGKSSLTAPAPTPARSSKPG